MSDPIKLTRYHIEVEDVGRHLGELTCTESEGGYWVPYHTVQQRIEQLERERDEASLRHDIERQIKALEDLRESVELDWWSDSKVEERIEQLRKGATNEK